MISRRGAIGLTILGVLVGLIVLELFLRLYFSVVGHPGEEVRGWRNQAVLARADVVAIGDSMVYGYNVAAEAAWPQQLGRMLHRPTYQMAHGGWGPGEYLLTLDEALALKPKAIIVGFYLGNDLGDAYARVYRTAHDVDAYPAPELRPFTSTDPKVRELLQRAEGIDPGFLQWSVLRCDPEAGMVKPAPHWLPMGDKLAAPPAGNASSQQQAAWRATLGRARTAISPLLHMSVLYITARPAIDRVIRMARPGPRDYGSPICVHFRDRQMQTVLAGAERRALLDLTDPRIAEGKRISLAIFQAMAERCRRAGIRLYILITPTKESVFRARASSLAQSEPYLRGEWDAEAQVRSETFTFLSRAGIDAIDPLPALQAVVASGINPYPETDPHPIASGYEAIARAVATRLQRDGFGTSP